MKHIITYFIGVCLLSVSFLVFINASASFLITDIVGKRKNFGNDVGTLGFADELVAIVACPMWGMISDRVGQKFIVPIGYTIIALALFTSVHVSSVRPGLLAARVLFSIGGAAVSTMITAMLPSIHLNERATRRSNALSSSDQEAHNINSRLDNEILTEVTNHSPPRDTQQPPGKSDGPDSFQVAGIVGTAAGCGALLAVFGYLRLPLGFHSSGLTAEEALRLTFYVVASVSLLAALLCVVGLDDQRVSASSASRSKHIFSVLRLPALPFFAACRHTTIALAYLGGFIARASSVGISSFIPLWVNAFFIKEGHCSLQDPENIRSTCTEAVILASILTGISQLAALLSAPLWGFVSSRYRLLRAPLLVAAVCGMIGYIGISAIDDPRLLNTGSKLAIPFLAALLGIGQVGTIVCSLGLLGATIAEEEFRNLSPHYTAILSEDSRENYTTAEVEDTESTSHPSSTEASVLLARDGILLPRLGDIKGSIAGAYSLAGGLGILLLTKLGGYLFDIISPVSPFILLVTFNALLAIGGILSIIQNRFNIE